MSRTEGETRETQTPAHYPRAVIAPVVLAGASLLVLVITLVRWTLSLKAALNSIAGRYDFSSYYAAAAALRANLHANIYDPAVLARAGAVSHTLVNPPLPYTYPPLFAIVLSPFTAFSFRVLSRVWLLGNAALWLAITLMLAIEIRHILNTLPVDILRRAGRVAQGEKMLVALALACWLSLNFAPADQTLSTGQINFLVLAPLVVVPWLTRHRHERWVGVVIAIAAMLKFTPAVLIVYLLLRRRWEAAVSAVVGLVILTIGSVALVGPGVVLAALPQALHVGVGDAGLGHNEALFAPILTDLAGTSVAGVAGIIAKLLLLALAFIVGYALWRLPLRDRDGSVLLATGDGIGYGIALCAMLLLSPTAWVHHYVWLLPAGAVALGLACVWFVAALAVRPVSLITIAVVFVAVIACICLGLNLPYGWDSQPNPTVTQLWGIHLWPLALEIRPLGSILLLAVLAHFGFRSVPDVSAAALKAPPMKAEAQVNQ